jgi:pimeloyl-ACP methyl ester carboxylesterase
MVQPPIRLVEGNTKVELLKLKTSDGTELDANLVLPTNANRAVVLLHMLGGNKDTWKDLQHKLADNGFASIVANWRGNRGSGDEQDKRDYKARKHSHYQKFHFDALALYDYMLALGFEPKCIAMGGGSVGSSTTLKVTALYRTEIPAIFLLSPGTKYVGVDSLAHSKELGNQPAYIMYATEAPGEEYSAKSISANISNKNDLIVEGIPGNFRTAHAELAFLIDPSLQDRLVKFLKKHVPVCTR